MSFLSSLLLPLFPAHVTGLGRGGGGVGSSKWMRISDVVANTNLSPLFIIEKRLGEFSESGESELKKGQVFPRCLLFRLRFNNFQRNLPFPRSSSSSHQHHHLPLQGLHLLLLLPLQLLLKFLLLKVLSSLSRSFSDTKKSIFMLLSVDSVGRSSSIVVV